MTSEKLTEWINWAIMKKKDIELTPNRTVAKLTITEGTAAMDAKRSQPVDPSNPRDKGKPGGIITSIHEELEKVKETLNKGQLFSHQFLIDFGRGTYHFINPGVSVTTFELAKNLSETQLGENIDDDTIPGTEANFSPEEVLNAINELLGLKGDHVITIDKVQSCRLTPKEKAVLAIVSIANQTILGILAESSQNHLNTNYEMMNMEPESLHLYSGLLTYTFIKDENDDIRLNIQSLKRGGQIFHIDENMVPNRIDNDPENTKYNECDQTVDITFEISDDGSISLKPHLIEQKISYVQNPLQLVKQEQSSYDSDLSEPDLPSPTSNETFSTPPSSPDIETDNKSKENQS